MLYGLWQRQAYFETEPVFYSASPPPIYVGDKRRRCYIFDWPAMLDLSQHKTARRAKKKPGTIPKFSRSDREVKAAALQLIQDRSGLPVDLIPLPVKRS